MQIHGLMAQSVTGRVFENIDDKNHALVGANIIQLNTQNGTTTDVDGRFEINLINNKPNTLIISFVSYQNDTILLENGNFRNHQIILKESKNLNEVQVVARQRGNFVSRTETLGLININEGELQKAACCNLSESFENSAAVDVSYSDAVTGAKQIQLLGLAGIYTQFLTENIPNFRGLATSYGLGYVPGSWMESIQIAKGTSSVINGYESMAGQINIEYKKPDDGDKIFFNIYGNHDGKLEANFNNRINLNDKWSTAFLGHAEYFSVKHDANGDSFLDMPLMAQINLFNRWRFKGKNFRFQFGIKYLTEERQGGQMDFKKGGKRTIENPYGIGIKTKRIEGFAKIGYIFKHRAASSWGFQNQIVLHEQNSFFGLNNYDAKQFSYYGNLMLQSWIGDQRHQVTAGMSFNMDNYYETLNDSIFNRFEKVTGTFFQYSYSNKSNLNVIGGLRLDYHNIFGLLFTPRLHAKYNINESNIIRASGGKGYRSANVLTENTSLLASSKHFVFVEELKIESSWNMGISYTKYLNIASRQLTLTADFFHTQFQNQVIIDREQNLQSVYVYNLNGASRSNSFQVEAFIEPFKNFQLTAAFRFNDVKTTINNKFIEKAMVNKYKGLVSVSYQTPYKKWQFDLNTQINGDQRLPYTGFYAEEYQLTKRSPVYVVMNAQITYYLKKWDIYIGGENLTNYRQQDPIIASDDPFGKYFDSSVVWGPISGIKVFAGFRFKIESTN
jgi:outer membrane receptor for ferrienterochelin and colicin